MPKRVKVDPNEIVSWKNDGLTWEAIDKRRGKTSGTTRRWLKNNKIEVCIQPGIFYWVALDKKQRVTI